MKKQLKRRSVYARELRSPKYKPRVVPNKKRKMQRAWTRNGGARKGTSDEA